MLQIQLPHPVFFEQGSRSLRLASEDALALHHYQQFMLRRAPDNLHRHVQCIFSLLKAEPVSRDALFGALLDLFIVLEEKGLRLRRRMLVAAKNHLPEADLTFLNRHLSSGLHAHTVVADAGLSVLTQGFSGSSKVIYKAVQPAAHPVLSLYEQAVSILEYGDIDQATELLVQALQQQPNDEQIADELLAIYQHQKNEAGIDAIRLWFIENNLSLPNNWPLL